MKISVVIPVHNEGKILIETFGGLEKQKDFSLWTLVRYKRHPLGVVGFYVRKS